MAFSRYGCNSSYALLLSLIHILKEYEHIIIGFGKGGKTLAAALAKKGFQVALIERSDKMFGGTCPNVACLPTKFLENRARLSKK